MRNSKKILREEYNDPDCNKYNDSKNFEDKYLKVVKEKTFKGPIELKHPEEDEVLKEMKLEYAQKKT